MQKINDSPKIAVIGCGDWGKNLVRNFYELGALATVCETHSGAAASMQEKYGVSISSMEEILENEEIKGIVISVPSHNHFKVAKEALERGKHVFVEKPFATNSVEGQKLCETASKHNKTLMVGHLLRYHSGFRKVKELVQAGEIGDVKYIETRRTNFGKFYENESILWDYAPHDFSMIFALMGEEAPIQIHESNLYAHYAGISDVLSVELGFASGVKSLSYLSRFSAVKEQSVAVTGTKGIIVFNDVLPWEEKVSITYFDGKGCSYPSTKTSSTINILPSEPLKLECQHFLDCILGKEECMTSAEEALPQLGIIEKVDQMLRSQKAA